MVRGVTVRSQWLHFVAFCFCVMMFTLGLLLVFLKYDHDSQFERSLLSREIVLAAPNRHIIRSRLDFVRRVRADQPEQGMAFDLEFIKQIKRLAPQISAAYFAEAEVGDVSSPRAGQLAMVAGTPDVQLALGMQLLLGDGFTNTDIVKGNRVIVLEEKAALRLFGRLPKVGATLTFDPTGFTFRVVGVARFAEKLGGLEYVSASGDVEALVPIGTLGDTPQADRVHVLAEPGTLRQTLAQLQDISASVYSSRFEARSSLDRLEQHFVRDRQASAILLALVLITLLSGALTMINVISAEMKATAWRVGMAKVLGASNASIIKRWLVTFVVQAVFSALVGALITPLVVRLVVSLTSTRLEFDALTLAKAAVSALVLVLIFSICLAGFPAIQTTRIQPSAAMRER